MRYRTHDYISRIDRSSDASFRFQQAILLKEAAVRPIFKKLFTAESIAVCLVLMATRSFTHPLLDGFVFVWTAVVLEIINQIVYALAKFNMLVATRIRFGLYLVSFHSIAFMGIYFNDGLNQSIIHRVPSSLAYFLFAALIGMFVGMSSTQIGSRFWVFRDFPTWFIQDLAQICRNCGYDVSGTILGGRCPECGSPLISSK